LIQLKEDFLSHHPTAARAGAAVGWPG